MGRRHRPRGGRASSPTSRGLPELSCPICAGSWSPPHRGRALTDDLPVSVGRGWHGPRYRGDLADPADTPDTESLDDRLQLASCAGERVPHVAAVVPVRDARPDELTQPLGQQGGGTSAVPRAATLPTPVERLAGPGSAERRSSSDAKRLGSGGRDRARDPWTAPSRPRSAPDGPRRRLARELTQVSNRGRRASWPVGRVLCTRLRGPAAIHLGLPLPAASCGLPASIGRAALNRSRRSRAIGADPS
jgi:hypothetical protein